jgi:PAS domain-containing protein
LQVNKFKKLQKELGQLLDEIFDNFIKPGSMNEINIENLHRTNIEDKMLPLRDAFGTNIWDETQEHIFTTMYHHAFPRFVKRELSNAVQNHLKTDALSGCKLPNGFCICDASLPDCPITMCSDSFLELTQYPLNEVVSKNCRFLQGELTDRNTIARIKEAVDRKMEVTELVLNYCKNGTPFWNLLHISPLFNSDGTCKFLLGGQVDVSFGFLMIYRLQSY